MVRGLLQYTGSQRDSLTGTLNDAVARGESTATLQPREATLAGVEAVGRDFFWLSGVESDIRQVLRQATAGLAERLDAAPALAWATLELLPHAGDDQAALFVPSPAPSMQSSRPCAPSSVRRQRSSLPRQDCWGCLPAPAPSSGADNPGLAGGAPGERRRTVARGDRVGGREQGRARGGHRGA